MLENLSNKNLIEYYNLYKKGQDKTHRFETTKIIQMESKFSYHVVRLISEVEQILAEGDLDLQRNNEQLKAIRRGEWTEQQIRDFFTQKEKSLETLYIESKLPYSPDVDKIKTLLLNCLEQHYGTLDKAIVVQGKAESLLRDIKEQIERNGY